MKKKVLAGLGLFLLFMAVCTVISKGIYKAQLARVYVASPERKTIVHTISASGTVSGGREVGVYTAENVRVRSILVQTGQRISEGDALFLVDEQDLEEKLVAAQAEYDLLGAQISDLDALWAEAEQRRRKEAERLRADYGAVLKEQDLNIREAELTADAAKKRSQNAGEESLSGSGDGGDKTALSELERALLKIERKRAEICVEKAKLIKGQALEKQRRDLEDAEEKPVYETAQRVRWSGELKISGMHLDQLKKLKEAGGVVRAEADGMVTGTFLTVGGRTPDGACMLLAATGGSDEAVIPLEGEDAERMSMGDSVKLQYKSLSGEKLTAEGIVTYIETSEAGKKLHIRSEGSSMLPGQTVHMEESIAGDLYQTVLKRSALFGDEKGDYVFAVEEDEGILGKEERLYKIPVTVLDRNESYVAVSSSALTENSRVVVSSNRELKENEAVRVLSEK